MRKNMHNIAEIYNERTDLAIPPLGIRAKKFSGSLSSEGEIFAENVRNNQYRSSVKGKGLKTSMKEHTKHLQSIPMFCRMKNML